MFISPFFLLTFELFSLRGVLALRIKHPPSPLYKGDEVMDDIFCLYGYEEKNNCWVVLRYGECARNGAVYVWDDGAATYANS